MWKSGRTRDTGQKKRDNFIDRDSRQFQQNNTGLGTESLPTKRHSVCNTNCLMYSMFKAFACEKRPYDSPFLSVYT